MEARSRPAGSGSVRHAALFVCGSFVPWTGTDSIADINSMEITFGEVGWKRVPSSLVSSSGRRRSFFLVRRLAGGFFVFFVYKERISKLWRPACSVRGGKVEVLFLTGQGKRSRAAKQTSKRDRTSRLFLTGQGKRRKAAKQTSKRDRTSYLYLSCSGYPKCQNEALKRKSAQ